MKPQRHRDTETQRAKAGLVSNPLRFCWACKFAPCLCVSVANCSKVKSRMITSRDNSLLRRARAVRDGKEPDSIFVEGLRLCEEALASGLNIEAVIYSDQFAQKARPALLINALENTGAKSASVSEKLLESISYTKTPQGIVVLASRPVSDKANFAARHAAVPLLVVMHSINNPVNVGAIVRAAEAAGATGVIATKETADPFSPKALRGAMGSSFRLPIWMAAEYANVIEWCRRAKIKIFGADVNASMTHLHRLRRF